MSGFALLLCLISLSSAVSQAEEVSVLSFNVRSARGDGAQPRYDTRHLDTLVEMIREIQPDVILLQELDRGVERTNRIDQFAYLEERIGLSGHFAHTVDYQGGRFGTALFSRYPIVSYEHIVLPRWGGKEPRALQHAAIELPDGSTLDVFNTHIDPLPVSRDRHIRLVLDETRERASGPALLGGDFNARPTVGSIRILSEWWTDAATAFAAGHAAGSNAPSAQSAPLQTFPARAPTMRIDYLFYRDLELMEFAVLDRRGLSDHRPLFGTFRTEAK